MDEFLLSDESLNCYGFVVKTHGINLQRFLKNPIMLFMHERTNVIGRWENIRIVNDKLYATPVFDTEHEPGKTISEKVAGGFIRSASIGLTNLKIENIEGVDTVVSSSIDEVSIVDIPANENAVKLYYNEKPVDNYITYLQLSKKDKDMNENDLKSIIQTLGLQDNASVTEVTNEIKRLKEISPLQNTITQKLNLAYNNGIITKSEMKAYDGLFLNSPQKLDLLLKDKEDEKQKKLSSDYEAFIKANRGKLYNFSHDYIHSTMKALALKDLATFKDIIKKMPEAIKPISLVNTHTTTSENTVKLKSEWRLDDYRKFAPKELQNNPDLYERLLKENNNH